MIVTMVASVSTAASDIVLYASDASGLHGNWSIVADSTAAGSQKLATSASGASNTSSALATPADYVDLPFSATAGVPYTVWIRLQATNNSKYSDSLFLQFSDSLVGGSAAYRLNTTSALLVNLATDSSGASDQGWGWVNGGYWLAQSATVTFATTGTHTVRAQVREAGVQFDQIVLSPSTYYNASGSCPSSCSGAPGQISRDLTIVPKPSSSTTTTTPPAGGLTPFSGTAASVPGTIQSVDFDNGGEGVAYHDTTGGNSGGTYRSTDVDIQASSDGGYNVGWIAAGEWLNYSVNVTSAGNYTVQLRTASPSGGGAIHVGFNQSGVWSAVSVPSTGNWQSWTTVTLPVTLKAGPQVLTLLVDAAGFNLGAINIVSTSTATPSSTAPPASGLTPYSGTPAAIPGTIQAENFDNGGEGVAYHDTTSGNSGGVYRSTDVDIEPSAGGGYDIGWTSAGEWLNYTVNVASSGAYTVQLRVASPSGGGLLHVGFNQSGVWTTVSVPATGGWQNWTTANLPVSLNAGKQVMTLLVDQPGFNLDSITVAAGSTTTSTPPPPPPPSGSGTTISALTWNIQVNDFSETHARLAVDLALSVGPRPQIITFQEAWSDFYGTYLDELQKQTGQTWYGAYQQMCPPNAWNGSTCTQWWDQVIAIFSTYPIVSTDAIYLPAVDCWTSARSALRTALNVNGTTLQVFTTHLQTGGCNNDAQSRYHSMSLIKSWASNYSAPQILSGDFNADPDQIDTTQGMLPNFVDSWSVVGSGRGFTAFSGTPTMKLDYWHSDASGRAAPQSTYVVTSTGTVSDHMPVQTTFTIR